MLKRTLVSLLRKIITTRTDFPASSFVPSCLRALVPSLIALLPILAPTVAHADVITDWNNVLIDTVRATGGPPCPIARSFAMMHAAMYDAVNSVDRTYQPYLLMVDAPADTSVDAAAASAAYRVLANLYPQRQAIFRHDLASSLAAVTDAQARSDGLALGKRVARGLIAARANDGSQVMMNYTPVLKPGNWRPTPPDFTMPFNPDWGKCVPWTMTSDTQFAPPPPPPLDSAAYAKALNDVKRIGSLDSTVRTPRQTQTAFFWANDRNGTYKPPGHLNYITQVIAQKEHNTLAENARLFAMLNLALGDAGIVAWDAKYDTNLDFWRPITGIRQANTDGNSATTADPNWEPLNDMPTPAARAAGAGAVNTPPFPAYISGHATFAATHAAVLRDFYGTDKITFTITSDDLPGVERTYHSLSAAARENGRSRIYLGVHWQLRLQWLHLRHRPGRLRRRQLPPAPGPARPPVLR